MFFVFVWQMFVLSIISSQLIWINLFDSVIWCCTKKCKQQSLQNVRPQLIYKCINQIIINMENNFSGHEGKPCFISLFNEVWDSCLYYYYYYGLYIYDRYSRVVHNTKQNTCSLLPCLLFPVEKTSTDNLGLSQFMLVLSSLNAVHQHHFCWCWLIME